MLKDSIFTIRAEKIAEGLATRSLGRELEILETIGSTNTYLKQNAERLAGHHGHVVIALQQTAGRGRMQRYFHSPAGQGVYMSFFLEPHLSFREISLVTVIAVVAVCRALREVAGLKASVKWVNDVLFHGKKLCGILTEASFEAENGRVKYLIPGIGINVSPDPELPDDLREIVGAVNEFAAAPCDRNALIASILNHFEALFDRYLAGEKAEILAEYKSLLGVFGQEYNIVSLTGSYPATPVNIDEEAHLIVRDRDGVLHTLNSGEISIRPVQ